MQQFSLQNTLREHHLRAYDSDITYGLLIKQNA